LLPYPAVITIIQEWFHPALILLTFPVSEPWRFQINSPVTVLMVTGFRKDERIEKDTETDLWYNRLSGSEYCKLLPNESKIITL